MPHNRHRDAGYYPAETPRIFPGRLSRAGNEGIGGCKPPGMDGGHPNKQPKQKPHRR